MDLLSDRRCPLHTAAWLDENGKAPPGTACLPVPSWAVPASGQRPAPAVQAQKKTKGQKRKETAEETEKKARNRVATTYSHDRPDAQDYPREARQGEGQGLPWLPG